LAGVLRTALGAALAVYRIPGRRIIVMALHALLGLPPVVVGLALYLLLSRAGPLGALGLLFTPAVYAGGNGLNSNDAALLQLFTRRTGALLRHQKKRGILRSMKDPKHGRFDLWEIAV
jgi:hypothetical protein